MRSQPLLCPCVQAAGHRGEGLRAQLAQRRGVPLGGARHPARPGGHGAGPQEEQPGQPGGGLQPGREPAGYPPPAGACRYAHTHTAAQRFGLTQ